MSVFDWKSPKPTGRTFGSLGGARTDKDQMGHDFAGAHFERCVKCGGAYEAFLDNALGPCAYASGKIPLKHKHSVTDDLEFMKRKGIDLSRDKALSDKPDASSDLTEASLEAALKQINEIRARQYNERLNAAMRQMRDAQVYCSPYENVLNTAHNKPVPGSFTQKGNDWFFKTFAGDGVALKSTSHEEVWRENARAYDHEMRAKANREADEFLLRRHQSHDGLSWMEE